jgi:hypothetical protein
LKFDATRLIASPVFKRHPSICIDNTALANRQSFLALTVFTLRGFCCKKSLDTSIMTNWQDVGSGVMVWAPPGPQPEKSDIGTMAQKLAKLSVNTEIVEGNYFIILAS